MMPLVLSELILIQSRARATLAQGWFVELETDSSGLKEYSMTEATISERYRDAQRSNEDRERDESDAQEIQSDTDRYRHTNGKLRKIQCARRRDSLL